MNKPYINILQVGLDSRSNYLGIIDRIITGTGAKIRSVFLYGRESVLKMGTKNIRCLGCNTFRGKTGLTKTQTRHIKTHY